MPTSALQLYSLSKSALEQNEIKKSIDACRTLNSHFPEFFEGWWLAGCIHLRLNKSEAGLISTSRALSLKPYEPLILMQRIEFLSRLERHKEVTDILNVLSELKSANAAVHAEIALLLSAEEMHEAAIKHYRLALQQEPENASLHYNIAAAYRFTGDIKKCEASLNKCLGLNYLDSEAQSMRSSLRTQSLEDNHIEELSKAYSDNTITTSARSGICYALAKEFDDLNDLEKSFKYLKQGSDIRPVSYTHLRAHETREDRVCRLVL